MSDKGMDTTGHTSLDVFDFGVLLQALAQSHKVGTLRLLGGAREKYVHLDRGRLMAIYTPRSRHRVGRILYNMHAIEMDELRAALEDQRADPSNRQFGAALLERGSITEEQLQAALRHQMVEEVLEVFYWKGTSYEFFGGSPEEELESRVRGYTRVGGPVDADWLLLQVAKIVDDVAKFNRITPSLRDIYEVTGDPEEYLARPDVPESVRDLLALIDGEADMGEILQGMRMNRFDVTELFCKLRMDEMVHPRNAYALLMLAENKEKRFPAGKRARLYERASELGLEGGDVLLRTAEVYEELGKHANAARKYVEHARAVEQEDDFAAAEEAVARAAAVSPDNTEIRTYHANLLEKLGRKEEFTAELLEVARLQQERGEHEEADATLVSALEISPDDERVLRARIEVLRGVGRRQLAAHTCLDLARVRKAGRDLEGTAEALRLAVDISPKSLKAHTALSEFYALAGQPEAAAEVLERLVPVILQRSAGRDDRAIMMLNVLVERLRELGAQASPAMPAAAEAFFSLGLKDRGLDLLVENGESRIVSGQWNDAEETYARAVEVAQGDLDLAETLALVRAQVGDREAAMAQLRSIAGLFQKRGHPDRAGKAYQEMLRLDPFSADALLGLARLNADVGLMKDAGKRMHQLGVLYLTSDRIEDAAEYFDEACRYDPSNPKYVRALCDCLARVLKSSRCLDSYEALLAMLCARSDHPGVIDVALSILEIDPDHEMAAQALADSHRALGTRVRALAHIASRS